MDLLSDVRVLDFSVDVAGPYASKLFAACGADVIKVEASGGDRLRSPSADGVDSALFRFLNASKRSVVADLDSPRSSRFCRLPMS
jgi:crotonobetainyl-CoA:carnitine CoA-transferase CaiB-like acyl-CoA transferase